MTERRRYDTRIEDINRLLSMTKDNLTIIRRKMKNFDINTIDTEFKDITKIFEEVDVYRQHIDYLDYVRKSKENKDLRKL